MVVDYTYIVSCFRRKLAMHVKFWHSNWRQNITLVSTKRFTSERAIKIRVFAWYWVAFYARTPILRATCHVKFVIMVRVIVITLDRTQTCCEAMCLTTWDGRKKRKPFSSALPTKIQHCGRSELRLQFEWMFIKMAKLVHLASF